MPNPWPPVAGGRAGPKVSRTRELALPLTSYSTQESGSCISPGQHCKAGPGAAGAPGLPEGMEAGELAYLCCFLNSMSCLGLCWRSHSGGEDEGELVG